MKVALILPFLCALAAAAPASGTAYDDATNPDITPRQNNESGDDDGLGGILGLVDDLKTRQETGSDDDSILDVLDGSALKADSNAQNVDVADLGGLLRRFGGIIPPELAPEPAREPEPVSVPEADENAQNVTVAKRQIGVPPEESAGNGDDSILDLLDGDGVDVSKNLQNVTVLRERSSLEEQDQDRPVARGILPPVESNNGDDDESLGDILDGSAAAVDGNADNVTVLKRQEVATQSASSASSTAAAPSVTPLPDIFPGAVSHPSPGFDSNFGDDDDSLLDTADRSGADVSDNAQNVSVLRRGILPAPVTSTDDDDESFGDILDGSALKADGNADNVDVADLR